MQTDPQWMLKQIQALLPPPWWKDPGFLLSFALGIGGVWFSVASFREARKAKKQAFKATEAAKEAGRVVKIQTVAIELSEVSQLLDQIDGRLTFMEARSLLSDASRRVRRAVAPFALDTKFASAVDATKESLNAARAALDGVRPDQSISDASTGPSVYFGVEGSFKILSDSIADLLGLLEMQSFAGGGDDAGNH